MRAAAEMMPPGLGFLLGSCKGWEIWERLGKVVLGG